MSVFLPPRPISRPAPGSRSHLGRLGRLERDLGGHPDPSGFLPLAPDLLVAAAVLQVHRQGVLHLLETCGGTKLQSQRDFL